MVHSEKINHLKRKSKEDDNGKNNSRFFLTRVCVRGVRTTAHCLFLNKHLE